MDAKSQRKDFRLSAIARGLAVDVIDMTRKHIDNKARRIRDRIQDEALDLMLCINRANESRDPPEVEKIRKNVQRGQDNCRENRGKLSGQPRIHQTGRHRGYHSQAGRPIFRYLQGGKRIKWP